MARRAAPSAGPPLAHFPTRALLRALLLLVLAGAVAAQSDAGDKAALLAFKAGGDDEGDLASWTAATDSCGVGWDSIHAGWLGVTCCANGYSDCSGTYTPSYPVDEYHPVAANSGRVTYVSLYSKPGLRGDLASLAPLTELQYLNLQNTNAHGDIASLIGLVRLR